MAKWRCISTLAERCSKIPECRGPKGVEYPGGLIAFSMTLGNCAGRFTQRSTAIWLEENWKWLLRYWYKYSDRQVTINSTPSQSTICKYLAKEDPDVLNDVFSAEERETLIEEWNEYSRTQSKRVKQRSSRPKHRKKPLPQYCMDGKARKGCTSETTGRTEIDLRLYCPETHQTLALRTLEDKEGEQKAALQILQNEAKPLPRGVFTGDAGVISPEFTKYAVERNCSFLLAIKGNAGNAYDDIQSFNWGKVKKSYTLDDIPAHGRKEKRTIKAVKISETGSKNFSKYNSASKVYQVHSEVYHIKENKLVKSTRYFVGDKRISRWGLPTILAYIRGHWGVETYHFDRDVSLKEDDCKVKANNASRVIGLLRTFVMKIASRAFDSTQEFLDKFNTNPRKMVKMIDAI